MSKNNSECRIAYCKHGDAVAELESLGPLPEDVPRGGPYHYIGTFLQYARGRPSLVISLSPRKAELALGAVTARCIDYRTSPGHPLRSMHLQTVAFLRILFGLLAFRPSRILCAACGGPPLWACYLAARLRRVPLICTRHTSLGRSRGNPLRWVRNAVNRHVIRNSTSVMCHGPMLERELLRVGVASGRLHQFNLSYAHMLAKPGEPTARRGFRILFVGRIGWEKGVFDLLEAAAPLLEGAPEAELVYAGDGRDLERLKRAVGRLATAERIHLLGAVHHERLTDLMRGASVVATPTHSSSSESRCKVAIEALVAGRPVVAPNFGPFPYAVQDRVNGLLYPPDSVPELRRSLARLMEDPGLLEHLTAGARASGADYIDPPVTFVKALQRAFTAA